LIDIILKLQTTGTEDTFCIMDILPFYYNCWPTIHLVNRPLETKRLAGKVIAMFEFSVEVLGPL